MKRRDINFKKGFTLIEVLVALSLFSFIIFISTGSIFTVFDANRKSTNLRSVMDNLDLTLESITRTIRFGTNYHCDILALPITAVRDCPSGASSISVLDYLGRQVTYKLVGNRIARSIDGSPDLFVTSSDVIVQHLAFRVYGSAPYSSGDLLQPQVIIVVSGYTGVKQTSKSSFTLQTTVSQRIFDSQ